VKISRRATRLSIAAALLGVFSLIGLAPVPVLAGAGASSESYPPLAAGETSIAFSGSSGLSLEINQPTEISQGVMSIELASGTFAVAAVRRPECAKSPPVFANCISFRLRHFPAFPSPNTFLGAQPPTIEPGLYEVYVLTDGAGILTFNFPNLPGATSLSAKGTIDGSLERLQPSCDDFALVDPECKTFGHGGMAKEVGEPGNLGMVMSVTYAWVPRWDPVPGAPSSDGTMSARTCVSPNGLDNPDGSPEPSDHPHGCGFLPTDPDWDGGTNGIGYLTGPVDDTVFRYGAKAHGYSWDAAIGKVYAGFLAKAKSYSDVQGQGPAGKYAAFAIWLTPGIVCDAECQQATVD